MTAKPLIRIVDDDEALTASSAMLLEAMGWDVAVWHSGGAFLDEADLMRPGCLVLDVRMPGLTGLDVQAELERRGSNLPILFLSAHGSIHTVPQPRLPSLGRAHSLPYERIVAPLCGGGIFGRTCALSRCGHFCRTPGGPHAPHPYAGSHHCRRRLHG